MGKTIEGQVQTDRYMVATYSKEVADYSTAKDAKVAVVKDLMKQTGSTVSASGALNWDPSDWWTNCIDAPDEAMLQAEHAQGALKSAKENAGVMLTACLATAS